MTRTSLMPVLSTILMFLAAACSASADIQATANVEVAGIAPVPTVSTLHTPEAAEPAAGICERSAEASVMAAIVDLAAEGAPTPRCIQVVGEQTVGFANQTGVVVEAQLGPYRIMLQPNETVQLEASLGSFLALGAHNPQLWNDGGIPLAAPTLWLVEP